MINWGGNKMKTMKMAKKEDIEEELIIKELRIIYWERHNEVPTKGDLINLVEGWDE